MAPKSMKAMKVTKVMKKPSGTVLSKGGLACASSSDHNIAAMAPKPMKAKKWMLELINEAFAGKNAPKGDSEVMKAMRALKALLESGGVGRVISPSAARARAAFWRNVDGLVSDHLEYGGKCLTTAQIHKIWHQQVGRHPEIEAVWGDPSRWEWLLDFGSDRFLQE